MRNQMQRLLTALRVGHWMRLAGPLIVACVLAAFLATNVGADTTPTTYYACVNMKNGSIYMVNAGDTCQKGYTPISWNQVGPQGPQGPQGSAGPAGPQGPAGPTQTLTITYAFGVAIMEPGNDDSIEADCSPGTRAIGGGFDLRSLGSTLNVVVEKSEPKGNPPYAWVVEAFNPGPDEAEVGVDALCASLA